MKLATAGSTSTAVNVLSALLEVYPELTDLVRKGDMLARLTDVFGEVVCRTQNDSIRSFFVARSAAPPSSSTTAADLKALQEQLEALKAQAAAMQ